MINENSLIILLQSLVLEFFQKRIIIEDALSRHDWIVQAYVPNLGCNRFDTSKNSSIKKHINFDTLKSVISFSLHGTEADKNIYQFIVDNSLWYKTFNSYEENASMSPSISKGISCGFLARIIQLDNSISAFTQKSFDQAFSELYQFLTQDYIEVQTLISFPGIHGEIVSVNLKDNLTLEKVSYELATLFCIHYTDPLSLRFELFEGDYILKFNHRIPKSELQIKNIAVLNFGKDLIEKWVAFPFLSLKGPVVQGKRLDISNHWPIFSFSTMSTSGVSFFTIPEPNMQDFLRNESLKNILESAKKFDTFDVTRFNINILSAVERLKKSKSAINNVDRVLELGIAYETMINTSSRGEITIQLAIMAIKLITNNNNSNEQIYKDLKKFYGIRSSIVHGNLKLNIDQQKIQSVNTAESVIQESILIFMELIQNFSFEHISQCLEKTMYLSKNFNLILIDK